MQILYYQNDVINCYNDTQKKHISKEISGCISEPLASFRLNPIAVKNRKCLCVPVHVWLDGGREMNEAFSYSRAQIRAPNYGIWCCCLSPPGESN